MSSIRLIAIAFLLMVFVGIAYAGSPAFYSVATESGTLGAGVSTVTPTPGQALVFVAAVNKGVGDLTFTDSNGTPVKATACANGTSIDAEIWYECSAAAGAHAITASSTGSGTIRYRVGFLNGIKPSSCLDQTAACATGSSAAPATNAITPANEFVLALADIANTTAGCSVPVPSTYSVLATSGATASACRGVLVDIGSGTTTSLSATTANTAWAATMVSFLPAYVNQPMITSWLQDWIRGSVLTLPPITIDGTVVGG